MSLRNLAQGLTGQGHRVSAPTVAGFLREENFSLQASVKTIEGGHHVDRDAKFEHINTTATEHIAAGQPVISVDGTKKELIGNIKNPGQEYRPVSEPTQTDNSDFIGELGKVTPTDCCGQYPLTVGFSSNLWMFAVENTHRGGAHIGRTPAGASRGCVAPRAGRPLRRRASIT